ncbi:MAG: hypothetical protein CMJ25_24740 [Phycisphaerae bacterium]|nr:hypothetical protein [Phycisphaerae bacterium]|tara:strand:+ start:383 stop:634 length:252 start_codon:yes stop_codon:yes gene_type:complete
MGGVARIIKSVISQKKAPIKVVQPTAPQTAVSEAPTDMMAQKKAAMGSGYGSQTILTSAGGDEAEANVSKTVLGGGKKKKIKA